MVCFAAAPLSMSHASGRTRAAAGSGLFGKCPGLDVGIGKEAPRAGAPRNANRPPTPPGGRDRTAAAGSAAVAAGRALAATGRRTTAAVPTAHRRPRRAGERCARRDSAEVRRAAGRARGVSARDGSGWNGRVHQKAAVRARSAARTHRLLAGLAGRPIAHDATANGRFPAMGSIPPDARQRAERHVGARHAGAPPSSARHAGARQVPAANARDACVARRGRRIIGP
jgi:hypothetical protein